MVLRVLRAAIRVIVRLIFARLRHTSMCLSAEHPEMSWEIESAPAGMLLSQVRHSTGKPTRGAKWENSAGRCGCPAGILLTVLNHT